MKILGLIFTGVLFFFSRALLAQSHLDAAMKNANAPVTEGPYLPNCPPRLLTTMRLPWKNL